MDIDLNDLAGTIKTLHALSEGEKKFFSAYFKNVDLEQFETEELALQVSDIIECLQAVDDTVKTELGSGFFVEISNFEMETEEVVYNAFQVLSDGGVIIEPIGELPWSKCCATIIDKYGVCWWISI